MRLLGGNTCPYNSQGDLFNFIITAYGIHPSCGHACLQRGSHTNNYLIKDQVAPEHIWGLIHQGSKPRINPCLRHGYPGTRPGALDISKDLIAWSQTKNPGHILEALSRVFTAWSQTKNPSYLLGALTRVFCHGSDCLVPDQEPQECTGSPSSQLGSLPSSQRMALAAALNSTDVIKSQFKYKN
jgi:hypothetical protein